MKKKHLVGNFRIISFLVSLLLLAGINSGLRAQVINVDLNTCVTGVIGLTPKVAGGAIGIGPLNTSSPTGPVTMTIESIQRMAGGFPVDGCGFPFADCTNPYTLGGAITFNNNGSSQILFSGNIPDAWAGSTITFIVHVQDVGGHNCQITYNLPIVRKPIDIALVLDKSGSMAWNSGMSGIPRWDALKAGVGVFMTNLESFDMPNGMTGDRIGLTFFDNAAVQPSNGFAVPLITTDGSTTTVNSNLSGPGSQAPGGGTAFGAGLQDGFGKLPADPLRSRIIVVFTDGEQNVPTTTYVNVSGGKVKLGGANLNSGTDPIKIYPIGIGASAALPVILSEISMSTEGGGLQISTENGSTMSGTFGANFINQIPLILASGSPQIVDYRLSRFANAGGMSAMVSFEGRDSFIVNKRIKKLVFNVLSNTKGYAITSVMKDSVEYINNTIVGRMTNGNGFRTFTLDFGQQGAPAINSAGTWIIRTRSAARASYEVSLLVDDHAIHYTCKTENTRLAVGKPINLSTTFNYAGKTLNNSTVQAMILKPGDDLGDLLATTSLHDIPVLPGDTSSLGTQKYLELLKDSAFVKKLLANKQLINLTYSAADSTFSGQFTNTDVSGVYDIIFLLKSSDTLTGEVVRYQKNTVYVYFPEVDLAHSNIVLSTNNNITTLNFRPVGINGKYIGPGWGNTITVIGNNINVDRIIDKGDGSYSVLIKGSTSEKVTVSIGGAKIYEGPLKNIGKGKDGKGGGIGGIDINKLIHLWWFWVLLLLLLLIIIMMMRKKKP